MIHFTAKIHPTAIIGARAIIGEGASIGEEAIIGEGASIRAWASILTIHDKYVCNIVPMKTEVLIRIGCETRSIPDWEKNKLSIADSNDRKWWDERGKRVYGILRKEATIYAEAKGGIDT